MRWRRANALVALLVPPLLVGAAPTDSDSWGWAPRVAKAERSLDDQSVQGMFLVARRGLPDPNFRRSVVLVLRHGDRGTLGLIVNRNTGIEVSEAIPEVDGAAGMAHQLFLGGPVATDRVMFLFRSDQAVAMAGQVVDDVYFGAHRDLLEQLIREDRAESEFRVFIGHSGWTSGQLGTELSRGDWHLVQADQRAIFGTDVGTLWQDLIDRYDPPGTLVHQRTEPAIELQARAPSLR